MTHILNKPYSEKEKIDFIVKYNHQKGLRIEETKNALYALEKWEILEGDIVIDNTEAYKAEQEQNEKERIAQLYLTGADVERGIYRAKGMDFDDIVECVSRCQNGEALSFGVGTTQATCDAVAQELCQDIDIKALKIELKANNFYRGNPYVSAVGALLGFSEEQLDNFFEDGNYEHLLA